MKGRGETLTLGARVHGSGNALLDPDALLDHTLILGQRGSGKTTLALRLIDEARQAGVSTLVIDSIGDLAHALVANRGIELTRGLEGAEGDVRVHALDADAAYSLFELPSRHHPEDAAEEAADLVAALLGLLGYPTRRLSPEFALLETIVRHAWSSGTGVTLSDLRSLLPNPPFRSIGAFELDTAVPPARRQQLADAVAGIERSQFSSTPDPSPINIDELLVSENGSALTSVVTFNQRSQSVRQFLVAVFLAKLRSFVTDPAHDEQRVLVGFDEAVDFLPTNGGGIGRSITDAMGGWGEDSLGMFFVAEDTIGLHSLLEDACGNWLVGRMPGPHARHRVVEALDLVNPPVDEAQLDQAIGGLDIGTFVARSARWERLEQFRLE